VVDVLRESGAVVRALGGTLARPPQPVARRRRSPRPRTDRLLLPDRAAFAPA
jgi:hypothetical protein